MAEAAGADRAPRDRADGAVHAARRRRAPRQADALRRAKGRASAAPSSGSACASPRSTAAIRSSTSARDSSSCWSRRETDSELDLDHVALVSADPGRCRSQWQALGFAPGGDGRLEVGGAWLELRQGDPGEAGAAAAQPHRRPRRLGRGASGRGRGARRRDRRRRRRAEHARALRLGARPREARVHRAQALVLTDLIVAGAGMAGLVAAARARELGADAVVLEKGDRPGGSMLLSSGVVWRHRSLGGLPRGVPGRRRGVAAPDRRGARRRARLARVARRSSRWRARPATRSRSAGASTRAL